MTIRVTFIAMEMLSFAHRCEWLFTFMPVSRLGSASSNKEYQQQFEIPTTERKSTRLQFQLLSKGTH